MIVEIRGDVTGESSRNVLSVNPADVSGGKLIVYGLVATASGVSFYVTTSLNMSTPYPLASDYCRIIDATVPSTWTSRCYVLRDDSFEILMAPPFWSNDRSFYERLLDSDSRAKELFLAYAASLEDAQQEP